MVYVPGTPETPRSLDDVVVYPFLADVLAGEFAVRPNGIVHTLGRLMAAAYQKGDRGSVDSEERDALGGFGTTEVFRYEPSWMPGSTASAYTRTDLRTLMLPTLTGVRIESEYSTGLHVSTYGTALTVARPGQSQVTNDLQLGPELQTQRQTIAELAGAFYDRTYRATHPK